MGGGTFLGLTRVLVVFENGLSIAKGLLEPFVRAVTSIFRLKNFFKIPHIMFVTHVMPSIKGFLRRDK